MYEKDLDEIMKEVGRYWNFIEWLELVILLDKKKIKKKKWVMSMLFIIGKLKWSMIKVCGGVDLLVLKCVKMVIISGF